MDSLRLDGGQPALDFVNTLGGLLDTTPKPWEEHLRSYDDLLAWSAKAGVLTGPEAERLEREGRADPRGAEAALRAALDLRELIYSVLRPLAEGAEPEREPLEALRVRAMEAERRATLVRDGDAYRRHWEQDELRSPLDPLAHAALELITAGPLDQLKLCGRCRWLFLDRSRNHSRRWCSMESCGTDTKAERYVERRRARRRAAKSR
jgi:predicted RNA-binding Zn ribbon-like protein